MTWLLGKLKVYLAAAGAVLVALLYAYSRGKTSGVRDAHVQTQKQTEKVREEHDKIDAQRPDFDGAVSRLRKRSLDP